MAAFVFQSDKTPDKGQLRVATLADGRTRTLVELTWYQIPFHGRGLSWSPDGRYILYFDRTSDKLVAGATVKQSELWRIPVAGGPPERLGLTGDTLNFPALSPDGRSLAFIKLVDRSGYWALENFLPASELRAAITSTAR
jgi:Tol biopolymer transport system component